MSGDRFTNPDSQYGYGIPDMKKATLLLLQENFSVTLTGIECGVKINWSSKDRTGISYSIERKKINDPDFVSIDTLYSPYDDWGEHTYTFTDSPFLQNAAYRLALFLDSSYSFKSAPLTFNPSSSCLTASAQNFTNDKNAIRMYPNPAQKQVTIEGIMGTIPGYYSLQILDASGRVLRIFQQSTNHYSTKQIIDLSSFSPGIYFVRIQSEKKPGLTVKLMVQ
jgi:hypothetical protein